MVIFLSRIIRVVGESPLFPPLDQALIQAMACEVIAETKEPLSQQSLADLVRRSQEVLGRKISRSTVWRMLHEAAIKPWQHESWLFPRDPLFAAKAGPMPAVRFRAGRPCRIRPLPPAVLRGPIPTGRDT